MKPFETVISALKKNDPTTDVELVRRAYDFCMQAHGAQVRASGAPYYTHPQAVAEILTDLCLDHHSVITGLLHDTVEDTLVSLDEIKEAFGSEIARLVDGVTKLSQLELQSEHTKQAENFRKLVLAMSSDIRVLLVKLADRLHNMRTLNHIASEEKRKRIARETIEIYSPLAERLGMQKLKDELEDIAFGYLNPEAKESVQSRLNFLYENADYTVAAIIDNMAHCLKKNNFLTAEVCGRQKTAYSIWHKMQRKRVAFEQLSDIMAFRIVVDTVEECYRALGVIHNEYLVLPGRFRDYISTPKPNGYQSLHTGLIGPFNSRIEVQIRTHTMHMIAEYGIAAHWEYKQGLTRDGKQYAWLRGLLEILDQASNPEEFLEHTKLEMFQDQVFCFTPKGDLIPLPRGATAIDFAYALHSEVGDHTTAVKINGRLMPLRTILNNGDQIEIITGKSQTPSPTWERYVVTGKARSRIRRFVRMQQRQQFITLGKSILQKALRKERFGYHEPTLRMIVEKKKQGTIQDLLAMIGQGALPVQEVLDYFSEVHHDSHGIQQEKGNVLLEDTSLESYTQKHPGKRDGDSISIRGLISGMAVHYARCCHPLPGDHISGIVRTGKGITIHTNDCSILTAFLHPERVLELSWGTLFNPQERFVGRLRATFLNKAGSLANFSTAISRQQGNIANLKITNRTLDFWDVMVDVEVKDSEHMEQIIAGLRTLPTVTHIERG